MEAVIGFRSHVTFILLIILIEVSGVIVSPCKVRNLLIQPAHATSLKTKGLVNIIQIPPVFVQNVMIGICENPEQNVEIGPGSGRNGEFFSCHQRYSSVEVYIAESPPGSDYDANRIMDANSLKNIQFIRESVIVESGCDFTFNFMSMLGRADKAEFSLSPQQKKFLRSPFHPTPPSTLRYPPGSSGNPQVTVTPNPQIYQQPQPQPHSPSEVPLMPTTPMPANPNNYQVPPSPHNMEQQQHPGSTYTIGNAAPIQNQPSLMEVLNPTYPHGGLPSVIYSKGRANEESEKLTEESDNADIIEE